MPYLNKRARRHLLTLFFDKYNGRYEIVKSFIKELFCQKDLSFDESNQSEDILSQSGHFRQGSVPYVHLDIGESKVLFCLDSGCSHCLMTPKTYLTLKHLEKVSYRPPAGISLRNITDGVSTNIIETISLIPVFINQKRYILIFYITKYFNRNF